ncbi:MAG: peptide ABC transporter substrate-binding protein [Gaiellaceae bacterium]
MARALAVAALALGVALGGVAGAATPRAGGTVAVISEPDTSYTEAAVNGLVMAGAYTITPNGSYRENLVSRVTVGRRPFTLTYYIRPEARWSDGTDLTARDFVFTYRMNTKLLPPDHPIRQLYESAQVRRLRALDAKRLRVVFRAPFAPWRFLFHWVVPRHVYEGEDIADLNLGGIFHPRTARPIGSGPYLTERYEPGRQLLLVRNPRYWGPRPRLDRILVRFPRTAAPAWEERLARLRSGEVDAVTLTTHEATGLPPGRFRVEHVVAPAYEHLDFGFHPRSHPALARRQVRQAIAYGLDRVALVRELFGRAAAPLDSVTVLGGNRFYEPHWRVYRYDPVRARRLLESAGCRQGSGGIYECGGRELSLRLFTTAGNARRARIAEIVQAQLRRVGIEIRPQFGPLGPTLASGDFDLVLFTWFAERPDALDGIRVWRCGGEQNFLGWCNRKVTALYLEAQRILDQEAQARKMNEIDRLISQAVPTIPLFQPRWAVASRRELRNVRANVSNDGLLWNAAEWWLERPR